MWGLGHGDQTMEAFTRALLNEVELPDTIKPIHIELGRVSWG